MTTENQSCESCSQEDQHKIQDAEIRDRLNHIQNKLLVMSGKGGVGKSSVAAYLTVWLAERGHIVELMDVDLHGPSIPRLLGIQDGIKPGVQAGKAIPVALMPNLLVMSIESLMGEDKDVATIWRGSLKIGVIRQFLSDMEWSDLDYLIIDSPPGTGDEPLTIAQTIPDAKAVIVTTPQEISLADVRKSINFCRQVNMVIMGLVENMGGFQCPHCGELIELFKARGGQQMAVKENLTLLASLPIEPDVVSHGDTGRLAELKEKDIPFNRAFEQMIEKIENMTAGKKEERSEEPKKTTEGELVMVDKTKFAVPVVEGKLCAHFGHCEHFALIQTEDGKIKDTSMQVPPAH
ncbi:MAG: P-loop NTPase, partial [Deltaproteobacteria bacterium]|nr:P-loop NTPase [Deltaproteobacteria bacterium]